MDEDLAFLAALAAPSEASLAGGPQGDGAVVEICEDEAQQCRAMEDDEGDLQLVAALAERPQEAPRKYKQRGWELLEKARMVKAQKRLEGQLAMKEAERRAVQHAVTTIATAFPSVAKAVGLRPAMPGMTEDRALLLQRLSLAPAIRGCVPAKKTQDVAVSTVACAGLALQSEWARRLLLEGRFGTAACAMEEAPKAAMAIHCLSWQWDETTQRVRRLADRDTMAEERACHGQFSVQVMMQSGFLERHEVRDGLRRTVASEPLFARALLLEQQSAEFLLEGLSRSTPLRIEDVEFVRQAAQACTVVVLSYCSDRASANIKALQWTWRQLSTEGLPDNILPHSEMCALHGLALAKSRPTAGKQLVGDARTFATLTRQNRFHGAFRAQLLDLIATKLVVRHEARPRELVERTAALRDLLFGNADSDSTLFYKQASDGSRRRTKLLEDLEALCAVVDLGPGTPDSLVHWCHTSAGANGVADSGRRLGSPCCSDREQAVCRVAAPILNFFCNRAWDVSAVSRWTYAVNTLRRLLAGCLCNGLVPSALRELKAHWDLSDGMWQTLSRIVSADREDFHSKSKLRLLKVCRGLCTSEAAHWMSILVTSLLAVDAALYDLFGDGVRPRAGLKEMLDERGSIIARCQERLLRLLKTWRPDASEWALLQAAGGDLNSVPLGAWARRQVILLSSGVFDHFDLRFCRPPYCLSKLVDPAVSPADRLEHARLFLRLPRHCMSVFCTRLVELFPSAESLVHQGGPVIEAWLLSTPVCIDYTERSHAQMRSDLRSSGRARSTTISANRMVAQQMRAAHVERTGADPAMAPRASDAGVGHCLGHAAAAAAPLSASSAPKRPGGNPRLEFNNHKLATWKRLHAAGRPITVEEQASVLEDARGEWLAMPAEDREQWRMVYEASALERRTLAKAPPLPAPQASEAARIKQGLWGTTCGPQVLLPASALVAQHQKHGYLDRRRLALGDPSLTIAAPIAERGCKELGGDAAREVHGCFAQKKNICRVVLEEGVRARVDDLTRRFNSWSDSLGSEKAASCEGLLWLHGERPGVDPLDMCLLMADQRLKPKVQLFIRCAVQRSEGRLFPEPAVFPIIVCLTEADSRLSGRFRALAMVTSDELALELAQLGPDFEWRMQTLNWELHLDGSLMSMRVVGASAPLAPPRGRARRSRFAIPSELMGGDPLDLRDSLGAAWVEPRVSRPLAAPILEPSSRNGMPTLGGCGVWGVWLVF